MDESPHSPDSHNNATLMALRLGMLNLAQATKPRKTAMEAHKAVGVCHLSPVLFEDGANSGAFPPLQPEYWRRLRDVIAWRSVQTGFRKIDYCGFLASAGFDAFICIELRMKPFKSMC
ncbi:hypothetical protein ECG_07667 [Echinococcus granulosus]|uniref:Transposase n=1 Tax=Echinococcus granulosus TaxID=6210 RepID=A0A068WXP6_ECHGR|nr:hypothetical protein ECG_07667 [Echinococcus granulosus]CDS22463.1 hypothetical protein EgrG_002031400 [Echinococcus granulosus]